MTRDTEVSQSPSTVIVEGMLRIHPVSAVHRLHVVILCYKVKLENVQQIINNKFH